MKKGIVGVGLAVALTGVVATPAIVPVTAAYAEDVTTVSTAEELAAAVANGGSIKLGADITASITVPAGKTVTLDLGGKTLTGQAVVEGTLTVIDSTAVQPTVNGATVSGYVGGKIVYSSTAVKAQNGGHFILKSGMVQSTGYIGVSAKGNENPKGSADTSDVASQVDIEGGYVLAQEYGISAQGRGAILNARGGVVEAKDNAVIGGNGTDNSSAYRGGTTINVTGGTYVGHIKSGGYIACGVYHPQAGKLNVSGGDFIIENGVGVLMRGGDLNMTGGSITTTGNVSGKVGDSRIISSCYGVFVDPSANYPSAKEMGVSASVSGGAIKTDGADADSIIQSSSDNTSVKSVSTTVTGGTFENLNNLVAAAKFMPEGYAVETTDGETFTVKTATDAEKESSYVISASMKGDNTKLNIYFSGDDAQKNAEAFIGGADGEDSPVKPIDKDDVKVVTYTVTIDYDTCGGDKIEPTDFVFTQADVKDGKKFVLDSKKFAQTASRDGYKFAGWLVVEYDEDGKETGTAPLSDYLNEDGTGIELDITSDEMTEDTDYYVMFRASWTYGTYTVNFDSNGGSEVEAIALDVDDEGLATLNKSDLPAAPTREGYRFVGWQEEAGGKWETVEYPDYFTAGDTAEESATTLKAQWITDHVVVNFDCNGGTAIDSVVLKTNDQNFATFSKNDLPKNPTREGYTFAGWQIYAMVDEDGTLAWVDADLTETQFGAAETEEGATFTVRASWTRNDESDAKKDGKKDDESSKKALPKTGDASLIATVAAGLAGLSAAGAGLVTKRRNK